MTSLILGMIGFFLCLFSMYAGYSLGLKNQPVCTSESELTEEEKQKREKLMSDINRVFNYKGKRGGK